MAVEASTFADSIVEAVLLDLLDEIVSQSEHISHHTGLSPSEAGYQTDLVLAEQEREVVLPGFDMKTEQEPVGPNGEMRGGLLTGPNVRYNKKGERYNVIPINPDKEPGPYHKAKDDNPELFTSANMLASVAGEEAAMKFLMGADINPTAVYEWQTERHKGQVETADGGHVVFRTVSDASPAASWWYPPRKVVMGVNMDEVMEEVDRILGGV